MSGEQGWDPEVKKLFARILNSVSWGLIWMIACATAGIYFKLGYTAGQPVVYPIIFYSIAFITLLLLLRYLRRTWR
jgi:hypothetical protein